MGFYFKVPPRIRLSGDQHAAKSLIGWAKKQFMWMEWQNVLNLKQIARRVTLPDGSEVKLVKRFGLCEIDIYVPVPAVSVPVPVEEQLVTEGIFYVAVAGQYYWLTLDTKANGVSFTKWVQKSDDRRYEAKAQSAKSVYSFDKRICLSDAGFILETKEEEDEAGSFVLAEGFGGTRIHSFANINETDERVNISEFVFYSPGVNEIPFYKVNITEEDSGISVSVSSQSTIATVADSSPEGNDEPFYRSTIADSQVTDVLTFMARDCYGSYWMPDKSPGRYIDIGFIEPPLYYEHYHGDMGPLMTRDLHNATTAKMYHFNYRNELWKIASLVNELKTADTAILLTDTIQKISDPWLTPRFVAVTGTTDIVVFGGEGVVSGLSVDDQFETFTHNYWTTTGFAQVEHGEHVYDGYSGTGGESLTQTASDPNGAPTFTYIFYDGSEETYIYPEVVSSGWNINGIPVLETWKCSRRYYDIDYEEGKLLRKIDFPVGSDDSSHSIPFHIRSKGLWRMVDAALAMDNVSNTDPGPIQFENHDVLNNTTISILNPYPCDGGLWTLSEQEANAASGAFWMCTPSLPSLKYLGEFYDYTGSWRKYDVDPYIDITPRYRSFLGYYVSLYSQDLYREDGHNNEEDWGCYDWAYHNATAPAPNTSHSRSVQNYWWKREVTSLFPGEQHTSNGEVSWVGNLLHVESGYSTKVTYMQDLNNESEEIPSITYEYGEVEKEWDPLASFSNSQATNFTVSGAESEFNSMGDIEMAISQADSEKDILATEEIACGLADITGGGDLGTESNVNDYLFWVEAQEEVTNPIETPAASFSSTNLTLPHYLDNRADTDSLGGENTNTQQTLLVSFKDGSEWRLFLYQPGHPIFKVFGAGVTGWKTALQESLDDEVASLIGGNISLDDLITGFGMV